MFLFPTNYVILQYFIHFLGVSLINYFSLLNRFVDCPIKGSRSSGPSIHIIYADTFWIVWDLVEFFNESHGKISLGVEKTYDESMSAIRFQNTSKGGLTPY